MLLALFYVTIRKEYEKDNKIYAATILGALFVVGMFILSALPVVNLICWIVWLCSPNTNKNKKNFIWANIIVWVISVVAMSLFYAFVGTAALGALSSL